MHQEAKVANNFLSTVVSDAICNDYSGISLMMQLSPTLPCLDDPIDEILIGLGDHHDAVVAKQQHGGIGQIVIGGDARDRRDSHRDSQSGGCRHLDEVAQWPVPWV